MADTRLSDLASASALSASDLFYVVQSAGSGGKKATGTQLLTLVGTTYVAKSGDTMTGALTLPAGSASAPSLMFTVAGATTGIYSAGSNDISFAVNGSRRGYFNVSTMWVDGALGLLSDTGLLRFGSGSAADPTFFRAGVGTIYLRPASTTTACSLYISGLYTDPSNYERLSLSTTAGSSVNITAETLGTGGDNLDIVLTPAGAGAVQAKSGLIAGAATLESVALAYGGEYGVRMFSSAALRWTAGNLAAGADTVMRRSSDGVVAIDNGTAGTYRDLIVRNVKTDPVAFASLVAAATAGNGARAMITNCSHATFGTAADGAGAIKVPVYSDGASWLVG